MMEFNFRNSVLFVALLALPIAGMMLHLKLHAGYTYLTYILLFDIIVISLLYLFQKTIFYAFVLNSVFFIVGVIMHITYVPGGGISDILLSIPDFSVGYILWSLNSPSENIEIKNSKKKK